MTKARLHQIKLRNGTAKYRNRFLPTKKGRYSTERVYLNTFLRMIRVSYVKIYPFGTVCMVPKIWLVKVVATCMFILKNEQKASCQRSMIFVSVFVLWRPNIELKKKYSSVPQLVCCICRNYGEGKKSTFYYAPLKSQVKNRVWRNCRFSL